MVANAPLNDNFAGLIITVAGYTVTGYSAGPNANEFYVNLQEGTTWDTGNTPGVQVVSAGSLTRQGSVETLPTDAAPVTPTDAAPPVLMTAVWYDGSGAGVSPGDSIYLTFSEPVTSNGAQAAGFGLPVANDSWGAGASVSNGQNQQNPNMLTLTLQGNPLLTPGGLYSPNALTAGAPTGLYVENGANIVDAAGNTALVQTVSTAVDLGTGTPGSPYVISICWDDLSIGPRDWEIGNGTRGNAYQAYAYFTGAPCNLPNGLVARNNGNVWEIFTVSCSSSCPSGWTVASTAGQNQFELKVSNSGPPYTSYPLDLSQGPQQIATQLYSGHNQAFDLQYRLPTSITAGLNVEQTTTVTITATQD
jgi:hypothetical protein